MIDISQLNLAAGYHLSIEDGSPALIRVPDAYRVNVPAKDQEDEFTLLSLYQECMGHSGDILILRTTDSELIGD